METENKLEQNGDAPRNGPATGSALDYKAIAEWLYMVLDDIDSADDMAKENDSLYRKTVHKLQRLKSEVGCSQDGQVLEFRNPRQDYGLTRLFGPREPTPWPNVRCDSTPGKTNDRHSADNNWNSRQSNANGELPSGARKEIDK